MSNGYRGLAATALVAAILIAFGLGAFVSGLDYPEQRYQPYQNSEADERGTITTASNVAAPIVERTPCNKPQSETESDLCAQWRAAKAAERSADWTACGFWATLTGMALLTWQIMLTREAVKDTGDATKAMNRQNEIAENTARHQLRAYVGIGDKGTTIVKRPDWDSPDDGPHYKISIAIKNFGQTPAKNVRISIAHQMGVFPADIPDFPDLGQHRAIFDISPADQSTQIDMLIMPDEFQQQILDSRAALYYFVSVHYDDIFGFPHSLRLGLRSFHKPFMENEFSTVNELYFAD